MRLLNLLSLTLLTTSTAATPPAQEPLHNINNNNNNRIPPYPPPGHLPVIMSPSSSSHEVQSQVQPAVLLIDILGTQRSLTTFFSLARMRPETNEPLADANTKTTVLAPSNVAIEHLPRKPWENPDDYDALGSQAYDGSGGKDRADDNMMRFVQAHLVIGHPSPWEAGVKAKTSAGREIWWEEGKAAGQEGKRVVMPDGVEVERVASRVANGEVVSC
ncbi:hypothetical protein A9Z42_0075600 [Trichoderma parareesei]|uniref:FAS1 domain-containing protein n=1 Tax=Trichoderma parareesei TaxID=858221 RepID=A0A2H2ZM98_TRIPA|nr:hypothetical protein A9Z42_0075600 [Trichoderma parareesei]